MVAAITVTPPPTPVESPTYHLSAGRYLCPARYLVGWPEGIVKAGSTWARGRQRWGGFLCRGATLLDLSYYADLSEPLLAELWLEQRIRSTYPEAFNSREEARPYLGGTGGGWTECYRVPVADWPALVALARGDA